MKTSLKIETDNLIIAMLGSSVLGVAVSYGDIYLFHILLGFLCITWMYQLKKNKYRFERNSLSNNYFFIPLLMFFWYSLSLIWAPDSQLALKYIFYIFCGLIISFSTVSFSSSIQKLNSLFKILSVFFIIELVIALFESITSFRMPISSYSSIAPYFGKEPIDLFSFENVFAYSDFKPPTGFHWNTNDLAIAMVIILPFFLCSPKILTKSIGAISITAITVMTASRAVFIGLILTYCLYLIMIKKKIGTLFIIWISTIGIFWGMNELSDSENPRINEVANSINALTMYLTGDIDLGGSLEWRRELVYNGIVALSKTYGLGLGAGGSTANQENIGAVAGRFTSMHNFWVELLVEGGIIFSILLFFWYGSIIYNLFIISKKDLNKELKYYAQSLLISSITFIPAAIAASSTIYFFPMWIMFGMSIAVITIHRKSHLII